MPLRDDILNPIEGDQPGGVSLRYDPIYDKIKEARREEEPLNQGAWKTEIKVADWPLVMRLTSEAIATRSKDLQLAAWLTEALLVRESFAGLAEGLGLCHRMIETFWESLFPELDPEDLEMRSAPLNWIGMKLDMPLRKAALVQGGYGYYLYKESRTVGYDAQAKTDAEKKNRQKLLKEGKLAAEDFDKAFEETPKAFYSKAEKDLDECLGTIRGLNELCEEKFGDDTPSFSPLEQLLKEIRHTVHALLEKKREKEPDPVEPEPEPEAAVMESAGAGGEPGRASPPAASMTFAMPASTEPPDRREAIASVAAAAAFLRRQDPLSPAPYLMMRGLRWGELRAAAELSDPTLLEAPPTEIRQTVKRLAVDGKWAEMLEAAENIMALPCSRAWLDLQRLVVEACVALGERYFPIARSIRSELKALLRDLPHLMDATLMDDTAAANPQTRQWLQEILAEPLDAPAAEPDAKKPRLDPGVTGGPAPGWRKKFADSYELAKGAVRAGDAEGALALLREELQRQRSGRGRFLRLLELADICILSGKEEVAQPIIDDLAATIDNHKLDEWEDPALIAGALTFVAKTSKKISGDAKEKKKYFDRICRLDPVRALEV